MLKKILLVAVLFAGMRFCVCRTGAESRYDAEKDVIWVSNFPESNPLLLNKLDFIDNINQWDKVSYDKTTDTYTIDASLYIGLNDGTETYMQVGTKDSPKETLLVKGDVIIYPGFIAGENDKVDLRKPGANCLTLGSPVDKDINATLKIWSEKSSGNWHTFSVGRTFFMRNGRGVPNYNASGGAFYLYNSTVTAAVQDRDHAIGNPHVDLNGKIVMDNSVMSWFREAVGTGFQGRNDTITDSVFEDSGCGIIGTSYPLKIKGCIFRRLSAALISEGLTPMNVELTDCVFEENVRNWKLSRGKAMCIDCTFGKSEKENIIKKSPYASDGKKKTDAYPVLSSLKHVIIEVRDSNGSPVKGAEISIKSEQGALDSFYPAKLKTDTRGNTPGKGDKEALLMTEFLIKATNSSAERTDYSYEINIVANGYNTASVKSFKPLESWKTERIVLERIGD